MREQDSAERFEEMLGEELRAMTGVEPGEGFQARLRAAVIGMEGRETKARGWLWRGWAVGAVAAGLIGGVVMLGGRQSNREGPVQRTVGQSSGDHHERASTSNLMTEGHRLPQVAVVRRLRKTASRPLDREPELDTFPAVTHGGERARWIGQGGQPVQEVPVTAIEAMAELKKAQAGPLEIARIVIPGIEADAEEERR